MKRNLIIPLFLMVNVIILILVGNAVLEHDYGNIEQFRVRAREYLGTDNFTIQSWDGFLVAVTPDGQQYPTQVATDGYFQDLLINRLWIVGVLALIFMPIYLLIYFKGRNADKTETV